MANMTEGEALRLLDQASTMCYDLMRQLKINKKTGPIVGIEVKQLAPTVNSLVHQANPALGPEYEVQIPGVTGDSRTPFVWTVYYVLVENGVEVGALEETIDATFAA